MTTYASLAHACSTSHRGTDADAATQEDLSWSKQAPALKVLAQSVGTRHAANHPAVVTAASAAPDPIRDFSLPYPRCFSTPPVILFLPQDQAHLCHSSSTSTTLLDKSPQPRPLSPPPNAHRYCPGCCPPAPLSAPPHSPPVRRGRCDSGAGATRWRRGSTSRGSPR